LLLFDWFKVGIGCYLRVLLGLLMDGSWWECFIFCVWRDWFMGGFVLVVMMICVVVVVVLVVVFVVLFVLCDCECEWVVWCDLLI